MRYMLDTNMVGFLVRGNPAVFQRVSALPMSVLCISAVTLGKLSFGLARRPEAKRLHRAVLELLRRVDALPFEHNSAGRYGSLRAEMERNGDLIGPLDLLIAAHALQANAVLVTNDRAFGRVPGLAVEDWSIA